MDHMFVRLNEMWRRFFSLPVSREYIDLQLKEIAEGEAKNVGRIDTCEIGAHAARKYCCTIYWEMDNPRAQPDQSGTVFNQAGCEALRRRCGADGCRELQNGPC
ncbi:hypothetical protein [Methylobacterium radiotolerans]